MRAARRRLVLFGCMVWAGVGPGIAGAQGPTGGEGLSGVASDTSAGREPEGRSGAIAIFGHVPERRRVIPGLFVMHPFDRQFPEMDWTRGGGLQVSTWFVAAFMNSYGGFSTMAGVERNWLDVGVAGIDFGLGYRAGVLTGYDERLMKLAGEVPALPVGGVLVWLVLGPVGVDTFYVYKALTVEGSVAF